MDCVEYTKDQTPQREPQDLPLIEQLRNRLRLGESLESSLLSNDHFLRRYLKANDGNLEKAEKMLVFYTSFNKELNVDSLLSSTFPADFAEAFRCYAGAVDTDNRPVIQIPTAGTWDLKGYIDAGHGDVVDRYFKKVHWTIDKLVLEKNADFAVLLADLKDVAYGRFLHKKSIEQALQFVQLVESHSPGVTGRVILLNAPRIAKFIVATFQRLIPLNTEVIVFGANDGSSPEILQHYISEDQLCPEFGGSYTDYTAV